MQGKAAFGAEFAVSDELMSLREAFLCCMYSQIPIDNMNEL